jgi:HAE1 family hydrophobic/amphiphilic exporter-1
MCRPTRSIVCARDIEKLSVRSQDGKMIPLGALAQVKTDVGPALISLYNLYPSATIVGSPAMASAPVRRST